MFQEKTIMRSHRNRIWVIGIIALAFGAVLSASFAGNALFMPDPTGTIKVFAPCDAETPTTLVQNVLKAAKTVLFNIASGESGEIFVASAVATSDADGTVFVLTLKVEQGGQTLSSSAMELTLNKGNSGSLATFAGVSPASGKYTISTDVRVKGAKDPLDSKKCYFTASK
jgi:hypothetical protein